jgi:predicted permease
MSNLLSDVRYGIRMLVKHPGVTAAAVLSLSIGIGANTTVFSWIQKLFLRPFPLVEEQSRLVQLVILPRSGGYTSVSYPNYVDYNQSSRLLEGIFVTSTQEFTLEIGEYPQRIWGELVSGNYFDLIGVEAFRGRTFTAEEGWAEDAHPVFVISHRLWMRSFGGDPDVVGKTVPLNGRPFTIVGVTPRGFAGTSNGIDYEAWIPLVISKRLLQGDPIQDRSDHWLRATARLAPGVALAEAQAEIETISARLASEYPSANQEERATLLPLWQAIAEPGRSMLPVLIMLLAVCTLVLMIACANVANLLLAKATGRRREIAIRLSMGASRWRLVRQLLTESSLLYGLSGLVGFFVAHSTSRLLYSSLMPPTPVPLRMDLGTDTTVLAFTLSLTLAAALAFGLAPALQSSRADLVSSLKEGTGSSVGFKRSWLRRGLVVAQVALSMLLLVGTGLFLASLRNARLLDPGYDPSNALIATLNLRSAGYDEETGRVFYRRLLEHLETVPGVESASLAHIVPLGFRGWSTRGLDIEGYVPSANEQVIVPINVVGPGYFHTMRIPIVEGRPISWRDDEGAPRVAVINETMAGRYWSGREPIGGRFRYGQEWLEVVGIAKDGKYQTINEAPRPYFYVPLLQVHRERVTLHVRTAVDPSGLVSRVRDEVRALDSGLALFDVTTLSENVEVALAFQRMGALLLGVFGVLALILACVGIYGVMSFLVARRTQEIGIRVALGAGVKDVIGLVLGQGLALTWTGIGVGLVAAFTTTRFMSGILLGVSTTDPVVFGAVVFVLVSSAGLASYIPSRRASRIDPVIALKVE